MVKRWQWEDLLSRGGMIETPSGLEDVMFYILGQHILPLSFYNPMFIARVWIIDLDCLHRPWLLILMSEHIRFAAGAFFQGACKNMIKISTRQRQSVVTHMDQIPTIRLSLVSTKITSVA
uniref:FBA_2 domain-containing protein n=1 Tax=Panagrellus redivivus TaxID=6233 RepID=A0A7E4ZQ72_PANRE